MDQILIGKGEQPVHLLAKYGNRHGLIAGATGTGKTISLMVLAEGFSRLGVPVFMTDVKGDVAGLAMATMDLIKQAGAEPANFLDVGGGASAEMIEKGFRLLLSDQRVRAIFINIFGGILRCDALARGVVQAARSTGLTLPVIVRMEGTNVDEGRRILAESGLTLTIVSTLTDAVRELTNLKDLQ